MTKPFSQQTATQQLDTIKQLAAQHSPIISNIPTPHNYGDSRMEEFEKHLRILADRVNGLEAENAVMKEIIEELEDAS